MKFKALNPLYLGKAYKAGALLEIPEPLAGKWLTLGYIEKAEETKKPAAKKTSKTAKK